MARKVSTSLQPALQFDRTGLPVILGKSLFNFLLEPALDPDRPIGCIPVFPDERILSLLERDIRREARAQLKSEVLSGRLKYSRVEEDTMVHKIRAEIVQTLNRLRKGNNEFSIQPLIDGYEIVVSKTTRKFARVHKNSLPKVVYDALRGGKVKTIEDFEMALESCHLGASAESVHLTEFFRKAFEDANTRLFEICNLMKPGETVIAAQNRFKMCRNQAIHFLTELCHEAVDYQRKYAPKKIRRKREKAGIPIRRFDIASGVAPKDEFQSLEVVAYEGAYPIGYQRPHWAQMTLVFTILFNIINEHPSFIHRIDAIRKLNDVLNLHLHGRSAVDGPPLWTDRHGNIRIKRPNKHKKDWSKLEGYDQLQLKPLLLSSAENAAGITLFPNGIYVTVHNRPKSAESLVTKYFNRGTFDLKHIRDWGGFEVVIDPRDLKEQFVRDFGCKPSKKQLRQYTTKVIQDIKTYFKTIWNIKPTDIIPKSDKAELTEYLKDPKAYKNRQGRDGNPASSGGFVTDKLSFNCLVTDPENDTDIVVPIELQITLTPFKARFESPADEVSHKRYVLRRRIEGLLLAYVLDPAFRDAA